jgi:hypothetical protein
MLVITENTNKEAKRLKNQGTVIEPCKLIPDILKHLTPIELDESLYYKQE